MTDLSTKESIAALLRDLVQQDAGMDAESSIQEEVIPNLEAAAIGYRESKMVAEHLFQGSQSDNMSWSILRVAQIEGLLGEKGMWIQKEWLSTASAGLRKAPSTLDGQTLVFWIPVEYVARTIMDITLFHPKRRGENKVFNITNPASWEDISAEIRDTLYSSNTEQIEVVTWDEWLAALRFSVESGCVENLGWKALPFF
ncbi:hypothetical protein BCR34DRAFT_596514 [Clohesyomyces aquaticus]|uniref:Thioester reductase (TE) domain-containing protein n=1 Tax=Clohesyomyces aquaticus TaxID=1231657 RepID=A0A1Y2A613_9PLEO|nr:hypothetical protein BCR34DRAFT_596514 [Clohesyomyces aquaticus]